MCGRYVSPEQAEMERLFHIGRHNGNPFKRRFNVAPTMDVPVLSQAPQANGYVLDAARWTLVPHWWKQDKPPRYTHNARIEEAADKPMWREALRGGRCLMPVEGWYEWQEVQRVDPATGGLKAAKQPHFIYQPDRSLACFAALMSSWRQPDGAELLTCAVLTTDAAPSVAGVHERMPVVLHFDAYGEWLDPALQDGRRALDIARAGMQTEFGHHAVSLRINSKADDAGLCEPA